MVCCDGARAFVVASLRSVVKSEMRGFLGFASE